MRIVGSEERRAGLTEELRITIHAHRQTRNSTFGNVHNFKSKMFTVPWKHFLCTVNDLATVCVYLLSASLTVGRHHCS